MKIVVPETDACKEFGAVNFRTPINQYRNIVAGSSDGNTSVSVGPIRVTKLKYDPSLRKHIQPQSPFALGPMGKGEIS